MSPEGSGARLKSLVKQRIFVRTLRDTLKAKGTNLETLTRTVLQGIEKMPTANIKLHEKASTLPTGK